jgi:hypothetical protein
MAWNRDCVLAITSVLSGATGKWTSRRSWTMARYSSRAELRQPSNEGWEVIIEMSSTKIEWTMRSAHGRCLAFAKTGRRYNFSSEVAKAEPAAMPRDA